MTGDIDSIGRRAPKPSGGPDSTPTRLRGAVDRLPICGKRCSAVAQWLLVAFVLGFALYQCHRFGLALWQWDLLLITGALTFYVGLRLAASMPIRLSRTLARLVDRGVLRLASGTFAEFVERLERDADTWARVTAVIAALAMMGAFTGALAQEYTHQRALLGGLETIGAYVAGTFLGRMAFYGQLGWVIQRDSRAKSIALDIDPAHVDAVSGLKPVGEYYFKQAMVVGIPAFFLAAWWLIIPFWPRDYAHWRDPYLWLLAVAVAIELLAFLIPLWSFHRLMADRKICLLEEADKLSVEIATIRAEIARPPGAQEDKMRRDKLDTLQERYWAIENMATWPVDVKTRRRFGLNNLLLLVPLVQKVLERAVNWEDVLKTLLKLEL